MNLSKKGLLIKAWQDSLMKKEDSNEIIYETEINESIKCSD